MSAPLANPIWNSDLEGQHRRAYWIGIIFCLALFAVLRWVWIGHLLIWDEAMTLCTVRAFVSGGHDYFSHWFWRHPPLFPLFMTFLQPLKTGFAERVEIMAILFGMLNLLILFRLNRRLFGRPVALGSVFLLAVMPGAVFFDVWVKTDHPVTTLGLLAILFLLGNRTFYTGLCLGLAFLFKETAVFYAGTVVLLWICGVTGKKRLPDLLALIVIPAVTCCWWYVMVTLERSPGTSTFNGILEHMRFAGGEDPGWVRPWYYYFPQLYSDLGLVGVALTIGGLAIAVWHIRSLIKADSSDRTTSSSNESVAILWPLLLTIPSLLLLSSLKAKVPWIIIVLLPALATLQSLAAVSLLTRMYRMLKNSSSLTSFAAYAIVTGAALTMVLLSTVQICNRDYESVLRKMDTGQWYGASCSREIAQTLNRLVRDDERMLLTSFHHWQGIQPGDPCAVFTYYFERRCGIVLRSHKTGFDDLVKEIRKYKLDWATLSPEMGKPEFEVFDGFIKTLELTPCRLRRAYIFRTQDLYATPSQDFL